MSIHTRIKACKWTEKEAKDHVKFIECEGMTNKQIDDFDDKIHEKCKWIEDETELESEYGDWLIDLSALPEGTTHIHISRG